MIAYTPAVETALIALCTASGVGMFAALAFLMYRGAAAAHRGGASQPLGPRL